MDDLETLRPRIVRRDPEAWRALVHALADRLFRYVRPMAVDDDAARDIVQQTFIRLHGAQLRRRGSLRTACFFIATNLVRETHRKAATRRRHEQEAAMAEAVHDDPARRVMANEAWRQALALPEELREVMLLRYGEGFTAAETAAVLGIPEGTVKTRQRTALERLRSNAMAAPALPLLFQEAAAATPVPADLALSVEATIMAKVGTKAAAGAGLVLALLFGGAAALLTLAVAAYLIFKADETELQAPQPTEIADMRSADVPSASKDESGAGAPPAEPAAGEGTAEPNAGEAPTPQSAPEASAPGEITIRGRVIDEGGNGIAGAEVSYVTGQERIATDSPSPFLNLGRGTSWLPFEATGNAYFERRIAATHGEHGRPDGFAFSSVNLYHPEPAITDEDGRYEIAVPISPDRISYRVFLRATALGYRLAGGGGDIAGSTRALDETSVVERNLTMQRLPRVAVFRTDPEVHRLSVRTQSNDQGMTSHSSGEVHAGPGGVHQLALSRGLLSRITITTAGFAAADLEVVDEGGRIVDLGVIRLSKGRTLSGSVVTAGGAPVAKAALRLLTDPPRHAQSREDGSFTIEGAPYEHALLVARHEKFAEANVEIAGGADDVERLGLTMKPGVRVSVDVRLPREVKEEVWVALIREMQGAEPAVWNIEHGYKLDESGRAEFERVAPGAYQARAAIGRRHVHQRFEVGDVDARVSLTFGSGGRVFGSVIDRDGSPLANEDVRLVRMSQQMGDARARTGPDGRYAFEDVADGEYFVVVEERDAGFNESFLASRRVVIENGGAVEMNIDYSQRPLGNVLRGRVTLGGKPVIEGVILLGAGLTGGTMIGRCDDSGSFEIEGIPPGEYYALVPGPRSRVGPRLAIAFDGWNEERVIERDFPAATLEISLAGEGMDYSLVRYALYPQSDEPFGPDAFGLMVGTHDWGDEPVKRIENTPALSYWLTVSAPGFADAVVAVDAALQREVTVELKRNAGTVVLRAGEGVQEALERAGDDPVRRVVFLLVYRDGVPWARQGFPLQAGEVARFSTLAPGRYRGVLLGTGIEAAEVPFEVRAGESTDVELPIKPAARAKVSIANPEVTQQMLGQAAVRLYDHAGEIVRPFARVSAFLGGAQQAKEYIDIGPLSAGSYRAVIQLPGYQPATVEIIVHAGQELSQSVTLTLE